MKSNGEIISTGENSSFVHHLSGKPTSRAIQIGKIWAKEMTDYVNEVPLSYS
jgi:hypothetical protein